MSEATSSADSLCICIFDFDGCLFQSPMPNSELWNKEALSKLFRPVSHSGLGWNSYPHILNDTVLHSDELTDQVQFINKWYRAEIVSSIFQFFVAQIHPYLSFQLDIAKSTINSPNTRSVILTGRTEPLRPVLEKIFEFSGLEFDYVYMRDSEDVKTEHYKTETVKSIVKEWADKKILEVKVWDDHPKNVAAMSECLKDLQQEIGSLRTFEVNHVPSVYSILPKKQEKTIAQGLLDTLQQSSGRKKPFKIQKSVSFTGIKLDAASIKKLEEFAASQVPEDWIIGPQRVVINVGPASKYATLTKSTFNATRKKEPQQSNKRKGKSKKPNSASKGKKGRKESKAEDMNEREGQTEGSTEYFPSAPYKMGETIKMKVYGYQTVDGVLFVAVRGAQRALDCQSGNIPHLAVACGPNRTLSFGKTVVLRSPTKLESNILISGTVKEFGKFFWN